MLGRKWGSRGRLVRWGTLGIEQARRGSEEPIRTLGAAPDIRTLPTTVEVTSIAPSVTPDRTGIRIRGRSRINRRNGIHRRCGIDRIFINHYRRRRYND